MKNFATFLCSFAIAAPVAAHEAALPHTHTSDMTWALAALAVVAAFVGAVLLRRKVSPKP